MSILWNRLRTLGLVEVVAFPISLQSVGLVMACAQHYDADDRKVKNLQGVTLLDNTPEIVRETFNISHHDQYAIVDMKITNDYYCQFDSIAR